MSFELGLSLIQMMLTYQGCPEELPCQEELNYLIENSNITVSEFDYEELFILFPKIYDYIINYPDIKYDEVEKIRIIKEIAESKNTNQRVYEIYVKILKVIDFLYHRNYVLLVALSNKYLKRHEEIDIDDIFKRLDKIDVFAEDDTKRIDD